MSRTDAKINLILDALVEALKGIDGDPASYLTRPKSVKRWSPSPLAEVMPLLLVRCTRWGPNEPQAGEQHDAQATIEVEIITKFGDRADDPDRELHRIAADILYAVENDWQLADSGVPSLSIHVIDGYEPEAALNAATGHARAVVRFQAFWPWTADTP